MRYGPWLVALGAAQYRGSIQVAAAGGKLQAVNILGSIFYGVLLGLFLVAFFFRRVGGPAVCLAAVTAQALVIVMYFSLNIGYLWYNLIGCAACIAFSVALQALLPPRITKSASAKLSLRPVRRRRS